MIHFFIIARCGEQCSPTTASKALHYDYRETPFKYDNVTGTK